MHTHYLHLSIISLHLSALACTAVYTSYILSTLACTRLHFVCTYLHSLSFYLHLPALADTLSAPTYTFAYWHKYARFLHNTCKDISIIVFRPRQGARSLTTVSVASNGRQACRLLQLKFRSPVTRLPRCYNHLVAHTTVWANHSFLVLRLLSEQLKASYSVSG